MDQFIWIDTLGQLNLSDRSKYFVLRHPTGLGVPPPDNFSDSVPLEDGEVYRGTRMHPRRINLPLYISGTSRLDFLANLKTLENRLFPKKGQGVLRVIRETGEIRDIPALYERGLDGEGNRNPSGHWTVLSLVCYDPYFFDPVAVEQTFDPDEPQSFFPILPLRLSGSGIMGGVEVFNPGEVEAFPIWTVTGPGVNPLFVNQTTGRQLRILSPLTSEDVLVVDTRPQKRTVTLNGVDAFPLLDRSITSSLWSLVPGYNVVQVLMSGAIEGSSIHLSFNARYGRA